MRRAVVGEAHEVTVHRRETRGAARTRSSAESSGGSNSAGALRRRGRPRRAQAGARHLRGAHVPEAVRAPARLPPWHHRAGRAAGGIQPHGGLTTISSPAVSDAPGCVRPTFAESLPRQDAKRRKFLAVGTRSSTRGATNRTPRISKSGRARTLTSRTGPRSGSLWTHR
jgi:hypothetical protein